MKRLLSLLLAAVILGTAAMAAAESPVAAAVQPGGNANIRGFISQVLQELGQFNPQTQSFSFSVPDRYSNMTTAVSYQITAGMSQMTMEQLDAGGNKQDEAILQYNDEAMWLKLPETVFNYSSYGSASSMFGNGVLALYYSDIDGIVDGAMSLLGMFSQVAGLPVNLDEITGLDYTSMTEAVVSLVDTVAGKCLYMKREDPYFVVMHFTMDDIRLLTGVDDWLYTFENNKKWQDAFLAAAKILVNGMSSVASTDNTTAAIMNMLVSATAAGELTDTFKQAHTALQQQIEELKQHGNAAAYVDAALAVDANGDFVYAVVNLRGEPFFDLRYEGSSLVARLGTSGYEKVTISSADPSRADFTYTYRDSVYWKGYATQARNADGWTLSVFDNYSYTSEQRNPLTGRSMTVATPIKIFDVVIGAQKPFSPLSAQNPTRITWDWIMKNLMSSMGGRPY